MGLSVASRSRWGGTDDLSRLSSEEALTSLDIPDPDARCGSFSGGEKRRVALARLLVSRPDVLLLDEPTDHLDAFVTDWLEDWFLETRIPLVLVTHDRYLLERVCDRIVELDASKLWSYQGGYSDYLEQRAARIAAEERAEAGRLAVLRRETAWIRRGPPARTTKSKARIQRYEKLVDAAPELRPEDLEFTLPPGPRLGARSPPERVFTGESRRRASKPNLSRKLSTRTVRSPTATTSCRPATFSTTEAAGSSSVRPWSTPMKETVSPTSRRPASGASCPRSRRRNVDLPAPFGPMTPSRMPGPSSRSNGERIVRSP